MPHCYWRIGARPGVTDHLIDQVESVPRLLKKSPGTSYSSRRRTVLTTKPSLTTDRSQPPTAGTRHNTRPVSERELRRSLLQVIAIESTDHMVDKSAMCRRAASLLRPGGRLIICAWLAADHLGRWPNRILLEAICDEGRMPGMGSEQDYRNWITAAGFSLVRFDDLTRQVRKTWSVCARRFAWALLTRRDYRRYLLDQRSRNRAFAMTLFRILLAYWLGAMRYGVFCATLRR